MTTRDTREDFHVPIDFEDTHDTPEAVLAAACRTATPKCNCGFISSYDDGHMPDCAIRQLPTPSAILAAMPDWTLVPRVATADWTGSTKRAAPDAEVARLRQVEAAARAFMAHYEGINVKSQALANLRAALAKP